LQRADEALGFAVRLGPARPGSEVPDALGAEELGEGPRLRVRHRVVGHEPLDPDAVVSEEGERLPNEADRARRELVGPDGHERQPRGIVDRDVEVIVSARGMVAGTIAEHPVATAFGYPAEPLDVDVDELARPLANVPDRRTGQAVGMRQTTVPVPPEHAVHR
jgi:hypothetical protein